MTAPVVVEANNTKGAPPPSRPPRTDPPPTRTNPPKTNPPPPRKSALAALFAVLMVADCILQVRP